MLHDKSPFLQKECFKGINPEEIQQFTDSQGSMTERTNESQCLGSDDPDGEGMFCRDGDYDHDN